ncbi:hypothetical protein BDV59DRAFT_119903 [Aspergillus ambiguus]|uniref:uncharacterized protein n=1 Tax=Aspergillus ambiguus TaxID=176160 RepID=UPI003CCD6914
MSISCLVLNEQGNLSNADIEKDFQIELVIVTDSWDIYVPTVGGAVPFRTAGEGARITASLRVDQLERADNAAMNPILRSAISQAIRHNPQIGRVWVVLYEGVQKFLFSLFAAVDAETQNLQVAPCFWYRALAIAQQKLAGINDQPKTAYNHHDPSTEQEKSAVLEGDYSSHILDEYQYQLMQLEMVGKKRLKTARYIEQA